MSMDDRWLARDPQTMLNTFPWFAGERFDLIMRDLRTAGGRSLLLAEGFRLLPRLVHPLLKAPWHGAWLIPTPEFRRAAFGKRAEEEQFWLRTSDPASALERLLQREALFGELVMREARELGLKTIAIDGTRTPGDVAEEVADWFRLDVSTAGKEA